MSPAPADYVDVAERIRQFKQEYPNGSLQTRPPSLLLVGDKTFVYVQALAYRTPDDERPGIGTAWEPVPGPTPFTRDSELMNAETSAWGRAIVALGFETKKIASANEVRNRRVEPESTTTDDGYEPQFQPPPSAAEKLMTTGTRDMLKQVVESLQKGFPKPDQEHTYWADVQTFIWENFSKTKTQDLTEAEAVSVVLEFEKRLVNEGNLAEFPAE